METEIMVDQPDQPEEISDLKEKGPRYVCRYFFRSTYKRRGKIMSMRKLLLRSINLLP